MTSTWYTNADDRDGETDPGPERSDALIAVIEEYESAPDECTLFPVDAGAENITAWITAKEGSFVALDEMR